MVRNKFFVGMLAMALIFGAVLASCENGAQEIKGTVTVDPDKAPAVSGVTVTPTTDGLYLIVQWTAADNVSDTGYEVFYRPEGKKTESSLSALLNNYGPYNDYTYDTANGKQEANTIDGIDNFSVRVPVLLLSSSVQAVNYNFGVQTADIYLRVSDIIWSAAQTIPQVPVYATVFTSGNITYETTSISATPGEPVIYTGSVIAGTPDNSSQFVISELTLGGSTELRDNNTYVGSWAYIYQAYYEKPIGVALDLSYAGNTLREIALGQTEVNNLSSGLSSEFSGSLPDSNDVEDIYKGTLETN